MEKAEKAGKTGKIQKIFIAELFAIMLLLIFACGMTIDGRDLRYELACHRSFCIKTFT